METDVFEKVAPALNHQHRFIGQVPEEWKIETLVHLAEIAQGISKGRDFEGKKAVLLPYLRVANVLDGGFDLSEIKQIELLESEQKKYLLKKNDILLTEGGDPDKLGRGGIWKDQLQGLVFQNHLFRIRCNESALLSDFLSHYIQSQAAKNYFLSCAKQTTGIASINSSQIKTTPIPVAPLAEQRKIAAILSTWDDAIQTARQLLRAKQQRKRALMQQLLTGNTRLPGFSGEWREVKAGKIFRNISVKNKPDEVLLSATQEQGVVPRSSLEGRVTMPKSETTTYKLVEQGDFVISLRSFQGGIEHSEHRGIVSPAYTVLKPVLPVDKGFYKHYYKSERFIRKLGVAIIGIRDGKQISFDDFSVISIPYPEPGEQRAIALVLNAAEAEIRLATAEVNTLHRQKRGLMQQLLTGKRRVSL